jgi:hypothetical protein
MSKQLVLKRHYWSEWRAGMTSSKIPVHRSLSLSEPGKSPIVELQVWSNGEGYRVQTCGGVMPRGRVTVRDLKQALRLAIKLANAPADLWGHSAKARPVELRLLAEWGAANGL